MRGGSRVTLVDQPDEPERDYESPARKQRPNETRAPESKPDTLSQSKEGPDEAALPLFDWADQPEPDCGSSARKQNPNQIRAPESRPGTLPHKAKNGGSKSSFLFPPARLTRARLWVIGPDPLRDVVQRGPDHLLRSSHSHHRQEGAFQPARTGVEGKSRAALSYGRSTSRRRRRD